MESLLEDGEDPKEFLGRQPDLALAAALLAAVDNIGLPRSEIDGIEVYGIVIDELGEVLGRAEPGQPSLRYGLSVHQLGGGLHDIGEYDSPEEAREAARQLHTMLPHVRIFYDEISPA